MKLEFNDITVKIKKEELVISSGLVVEDLICKVPLDLVPSIKWEKHIKKMIIEALIDKDRFETVMLMSKKLETTTKTKA